MYKRAECVGTRGSSAQANSDGKVLAVVGI